MHLARKQHGCTIGWVLSDYDAHSRLKFEALAPEYLFVNHERLPPAPERLWRGPWRWAVYEVTTVELAVELATRGADFIETMAVADLSAGVRTRAPVVP
jgi:glycerophosphoryl diester phosphodiesterase